MRIRRNAHKFNPRKHGLIMQVRKQGNSSLLRICLSYTVSAAGNDSTPSSRNLNTGSRSYLQSYRSISVVTLEK